MIAFVASTLASMPRPLAVALASLAAVWLAAGLWLVSHAPFASGTDESINYVAFAAAKNRWATEADFRHHGINFYYYPPLYFLLFAPLPADEETFVTNYPREAVAAPPTLFMGGHRVVADDVANQVPPALDRLYRGAKVLSLLMGLLTAALVGLVGASLVKEPRRGWAFAVSAGSLLLVPQFLYYATLVNNDVLVNLWCALGALLFVRPMADDSKHRGLQLMALAGVAGLAVLTKTSGLVLLPLLALAAARGVLAERAQPGGNLARWMGWCAAAAAVFVLAGGWWMVRGVVIGDPTGMQAIRTAHGWALLPEPFWRTFGIVPFSLMVWRTYFGLFNAATWALPDGVAMAYLLLSAAWMAVGGWGLWRARHGAMVWPVAGLVVVGLLNVALLVLYNSGVRAPYGRLLFPSLALWHGVFAAGLVSFAVVRRPGPFAAMAALPLMLFTWTYSDRVFPATQQPVERVVWLAPFREASHFQRPAWETPLMLDVRLAPGQLVGFRTPLLRSGWPILGGEVRCSMEGPLGGGRMGKAALVPFHYSENDGHGTTRWAELRLPRPITIEGEPVVELRFSATAPSTPGADVRWSLVAPIEGQRAGLIRLPNGQQIDRSLALSAIYLPTGS